MNHMTYRLAAAIVYTFAFTVCAVGTAYDYAQAPAAVVAHR